ncbi:MAG TPA: hypothetical protein DDW76_02060 [Cyanobacteria bacterium UBA11369]|nr:hypothetical protein [Cyanobacteria bacterium UBA11371]HBE32585.1 hypothetical protein [Cyanobacteria bacterium UBA11368]HBE47614.1 hypothetical protein [Cyanobacteria bacterium UBA11369]
MSVASQSDATPAYRGYRLQTLYTLSRLLESNDSANFTFQPEGEEDLAIFDAGNNLVEVVQVKAHSGNLALSSFDPDKSDSFFYRVAQLLKNNSYLKISIASFGEIGQEMRQACGGNDNKRKTVAKKLSDRNFLSEVEADSLLAKIQLIPVKEAALTESVYRFLKEILTGVDPESAFELLNYWLYICAENKRKITRRDVVDRINKVGRFLAERAAHHKEWFTAIVPLEEQDIDAKVKDELSDEFYRGISARYEHILGQVDVLRHKKLQEIANKFEENRVVIIHGASGQGKTTLAFRYLHEFFPDQWRFKVQLIDSREHALSIATAIAGQADAIGIPIAVYLDVSPNDIGWTELVKQLSTHRNIRILVTVREEDFRRASISGAELQFSGVELTFNRTEAQEIYQSLTSKKLPAEFLTFEDAWNKFGGEGPLMEFVYLVTQGNSLRERLSQQVRRLEEEVRTGKLSDAEIELLRLASVASAFESQLQIKPLVKHLALTAPKRTFELFEKEYLLRLSADGSLIQGLHPIRSAILADLLIDPTFSPWSESASICLPFIFEGNVESFLLYAFSRHRSEIEPLLNSLASYQPKQWTAIAGVTRALIWLGIKEYTEANKQLIAEIYKEVGTGFIVVLDCDIADVTLGWGRSWLNNLGDMIPPKGRRRIEAFQARQTDKKQVFVRAETWLSSRTQKPTEPSSDADWSGMAETIFWIGHLGVFWPLAEWLSNAEIDRAIDALPIDILADLMLGLSYGYQESFSSWLEMNRSKLIKRFRKETQTVALEDDGQKLTAHFIIDIQQPNGSQSEDEGEAEITKNRLHEEAVQRCGLLRKLLPDRELYACQGYGHRLWLGELPFDETQKTGISKPYLPISWLLSVNSTFRGLALQPFRPKTWQEYTQLIFNLRQTVLQVIKQLEQGLEVYFRHSKNVQLIGKLIDAKKWDYCRHILRNQPLLPHCAVDEWGFVDELSSNSPSQDAKEKLPVVSNRSLLLKLYKPFLTDFGGYTRTLSNFFDQAIDAMVLNPALGKGLKDKGTQSQIIEIAKQNGIKPDVIPISNFNLSNTIQVVPKLHKKFRQLLAQFIDRNELESLDGKEQVVYRRVWNLWYLFTSQPDLRLKNPVQESANRFDNIKRGIRNNLKKELRNISSDKLRIQIVSEEVLWRQERTLWIKIDGENPVEVYNSLESVLNTIWQAFLEVKNNDLRHHIIDLNWPFVVIVPLVKGKSLNATAWHINLTVLLSNEKQLELKWWNLVPHPIPPDALREVGLTTWTDPLMEIANKLIASVSKLSILASHIRDFERLPDLDEQGQEQFQQYIQIIAVPTSEALQLVLDIEVKIVNYFREFSPSDYENRPNLATVVEALQALHNQVLPTSDFQAQVEMDLKGIVEWANRLEIGKQYAFIAYLFWVSDLLDKLEDDFQN